MIEKENPARSKKKSSAASAALPRALEVQRLLAEGKLRPPSPQEVADAQTPSGGWTAAQFAEWGLVWKPLKGWRRELEQAYIEWHRQPGRWPFDTPPDR